MGKSFHFQISVFLCCSVAKLCLTLCYPVNCSAPGFPFPHHILQFAQVHVHYISDPIQPPHLLLPSSPSAFSLSQHQGLFQLVGWSHQVTKYWSFSFSINPSSDYSGLISFRTDCFDLLASQGTLKSLLQHHSLKASILRHSAFLMLQLSQLYVTPGKTIALAMWTFVGKVTSLLFSTLCRFVIAFLPGSKSSSNFMAAVTILSDFRAQEEEICHSFHLFPVYLP